MLLSTITILIRTTSSSSTSLTVLVLNSLPLPTILSPLLDK